MLESCDFVKALITLLFFLLASLPRKTTTNNQTNKMHVTEGQQIDIRTGTPQQQKPITADPGS